MTRTATNRIFEGPFKKQLADLADLINWLESEHDKSYVKAGDDKVYAYGGNGFVLVMDESVWSGLIEIVTPKGGLSIKPNEAGKIEVTSATEGESAIRQLLKESTEGIRTYYENRYWSTPNKATAEEPQSAGR